MPVKTKIYEAGNPKRGQWVLQWQTPVMPAPSFWYFNSEDVAKSAEARLRGN